MTDKDSDPLTRAIYEVGEIAKRQVQELAVMQSAHVHAITSIFLERLPVLAKAGISEFSLVFPVSPWKTEKLEWPLDSIFTWFVFGSFLGAASLAVVNTTALSYLLLRVGMPGLLAIIIGCFCTYQAWKPKTTMIRVSTDQWGRKNKTYRWASGQGRDFEAYAPSIDKTCAHWREVCLMLNEEVLTAAFDEATACALERMLKALSPEQLEEYLYSEQLRISAKSEEVA